MQTSMTHLNPAVGEAAGRCPPHAWITLGTTTSCSRCGQIRALDLPVPATGGDDQQRYQQVLRERARAVRAVTAHATRTRSAAHSADVLRSETERTPVTYP